MHWRVWVCFCAVCVVGAGVWKVSAKLGAERYDKRGGIAALRAGKNREGRVQPEGFEATRSVNVQGPEPTTAPPRDEPSSLVRITPVTPTRSLNSRAWRAVIG